MTEAETLAFVILPLALAAAGWTGVLIGECLSSRHHLHPGE